MTPFNSFFRGDGECVGVDSVEAVKKNKNTQKRKLVTGGHRGGVGGTYSFPSFSVYSVFVAILHVVVVPVRLLNGNDYYSAATANEVNVT